MGGTTLRINKRELVPLRTVAKCWFVPIVEDKRYNITLNPVGAELLAGRKLPIRGECKAVGIEEWLAFTGGASFYSGPANLDRKPCYF